MTKVPSVDYKKVLAALRRAGFEEVRQKGSHIRIEKMTPEGTIKVTIPAHKPIKRSTLSHILKDAGLSVDEFIDLL
ncbi:MAG TPA: type II toxin-antitoxin system HicA family toxin [bacterium]|nr:type II toxin-antitoxin system HicA family toxin [bacterium]